MTDGDSRGRAGRTKALRRMVALLTAAAGMFEVCGWERSHVKEIAAEAEVSLATFYKHFAGKYVLIAHYYAPLVEAELRRAQGRTQCGADNVSLLLEAHIRVLRE